MIYTAFRQAVTPSAKSVFWIDPPAGGFRDDPFVLVHVVQNGTGSGRIYADRRRFSYFCEFVHTIPVYSLPHKRIKVVYTAGDAEEEIYWTLVWMRLGWVKDTYEKRQFPRVIQSESWDVVPEGGKRYPVLTNRHKANTIVVYGWKDTGGELKEYKLLRNNMEYSRIFADSLGVTPDDPPIRVWIPIRPHERLNLDVIQTYPDALDPMQGLVYVIDCETGEEITEDEAKKRHRLHKTIFPDTGITLDGAFQYTELENAAQSPVIPEGVEPTPLPPVGKLPTKITPYIPSYEDKYKLNPRIVTEVSLLQTGAMKTKGQTARTDYATEDETKTVEGLLGPFGVVRKTADAQGRQRTTESAVTYSAGKIDATDTTTHTVWSGYGSKALSMYAKAGDWEIKVLPIFEWLDGKTIADMDTIYIDEGQSLYVEIEARQVQAKCTTATESTPGTLYWEMDK